MCYYTIVWAILYAITVSYFYLRHRLEALSTDKQSRGIVCVHCLNFYQFCWYLCVKVKSMGMNILYDNINICVHKVPSVCVWIDHCLYQCLLTSLAVSALPTVDITPHHHHHHHHHHHSKKVNKNSIPTMLWALWYGVRYAVTTNSHTKNIWHWVFLTYAHRDVLYHIWYIIKVGFFQV